MAKRDIRIGDVIVRRQPPVVGVWCNPPTATKAGLDGCVHASPACKGEVETCGLCDYRFCKSHFPRHIRRFECPIDVWRLFDARRKAWYDRVMTDPKAKPKVDVHFPDFAQGGEADG